jgi:hypothetical protein
MPTAREAALAQLDEFLDDQAHREERGIRFAELIPRGYAAIERAAPNSEYLEQARQRPHERESMVLSRVSGAALGLRKDLAAGHVRPLEEIVHADVFEDFQDFLDMASELLDNGFVAPGAVLAGSVLEEHVRKLAQANGVLVRDQRNRPRAFDSLATDLTKGTTMLETERKALVAWYGLRTAAAHGRHAELVSEDVARMIPGIRDFMIRHPA